MTDYSHVRSRIHYLFEGAIEDRIFFIEANQYVPNQRGQRVLAAARKIIEPNPFHVNGLVNIRPDCIIVIGESGMGKSFILEELVRTFGVTFDEETGRPILRAIFVKSPNITDMRNLFTRILSALGTPYCYDDKPDQMCEQVIGALKDAKIRALVIDELHNFLAASTKLESHMRVLRDIANAPLSLICAGMSSAESCINADDQLDQRFDRHYLFPWTPSIELRNFLATFEAGLPLKLPSNLSGKELLPLLVRLSSGSTRFMTRTICEGATLAINTGIERITGDILKEAAETIRSLGRRASPEEPQAESASENSIGEPEAVEGATHG